MRIVVSSEGFSSWGGGADFLALLVRALARVRDEADQIHLLVPENGPRRMAIALRSQLKSLVLQALNGRLSNKNARTLGLQRASFDDSFAELDLLITTHAVDYGVNALRKELRRINPDIVFPYMSIPGDAFPYSWIGYIPDFQHRRLPQYFSDKERSSRDYHFEQMLMSAKAIIVNSMDAKNDIRCFHPKHTAHVFALPFAPPDRSKMLAEASDGVLKLYGISQRYFLICNQFWIHKDHPTAFRAFHRLTASPGLDDVQLICTGAASDHRFPKYFGELQSLMNTLNLDGRIRFLGHIPKAHQLHLVKNCIAIVQPTRFEGGPGGGAAYDAASLGVPGILSDIAVNKEAHFPHLQFFKAGDDEDLALRMAELTREGEHRRISVAELHQRSDERLVTLGRALMEACNYVVDSH